jgi:uncharacterized protein
MKDIILIGASTRAAATSALRAGWTPWCADLFTDADLEHIATVRKVPMATYPHGLLDVLSDAPQAPVIYTGALENWPDLVAKIDRPLWGNSPEVIRGIRSPERWTQYLCTQGVPCPRVSDQPPADGAWLLKPRKSAGGLGIHPYRQQPFKARSHFLQERIDGTPCSAIFLGVESLSTLLLGVTQQLIGISWLNASGYQYCGNIGPLPLEADQEAKWRQLGSVFNGFRIPPLSPVLGGEGPGVRGRHRRKMHPSPQPLSPEYRGEGHSLRGLFGVDAIVRDGVPWPVEINPRYTASVEVLERSYRVALLPLHGAVFEQTPLPVFHLPATPPIHGKAILYARQTFAFPAAGPWLDTDEYADIPHAGEVIEQGRPVLTLFASAASVADCVARLEEKAHALDRRFWGTG